MKLVIDLRSLIVGIILGIIIVLTFAATGVGDYQCALSNQVGKGDYLYAVLNIRTGKTQLTHINTGAGHLVTKNATLDSSGKGDWQ